MKKNVIKASILSLIMASTLLTSCIDDGVSEDVKALREAQAERILAEAAGTRVENQQKEEALAFEKLENELSIIQKEIEVEQAKVAAEQQALIDAAENGRELSSIEEQVLASKNRLELAELAHNLLLVQRQIDEANRNKDLEIAIVNADRELQIAIDNAEQALQAEKARDIADAFGRYSGSLTNLNNAKNTLLGQEINLALAELALTTGIANQQDALDDAIENLEDQNEELALLTTSLETLQAVGSDLDSYTTALETANQEIQTLEAGEAQLEINLANAERALAEIMQENTEATTLVADAEAIQAEIDGFSDNNETENETITNAQESIAGAQEDIAEQQDLLTEANSELATEQAILAGRQSQLEIIINDQSGFEPDALDSELRILNNAVITAQNNVNLALARQAAYLTTTPIADQSIVIINANTQAVTDANDVLSDAIINLNDGNIRQGSLNDGFNAYISAVTFAETEVDNAQTTVDNAQTEVDDINIVIEGLEEDIVDFEETITEANEQIQENNEMSASKQQELTNLGTIPTTEDLLALSIQVNESTTNRDNIEQEKTSLESEINIIQTNIVDTLEDLIDGIENEDGDTVATLEDAIEELEEDITEAEEAVAEAQEVVDADPAEVIATLERVIEDRKSDIEETELRISDLETQVVTNRGIYEDLIAL